MLTEVMVRDAWFRAEALCQWRKGTHGHVGRCSHFVIWAERGEVGGVAGRRDAAMTPCSPQILYSHAGRAGKRLVTT